MRQRPGSLALTRRTLVAGAWMATAACSNPVASAPTPPGKLQRGPRTHMPQSGLALSRAGAALAHIVPGGPTAEMFVRNVAKGTATRIIAEADTDLLCHPAFSPAGRTMALVQTPPLFFGVGVIRLIDLDTGATRTLGTGERSYSRPSFSPDGKRLYYFRTVDPVSTGRLPERFTEFHSWAVFSCDAATLADERRAFLQTFGSPCAVHVDPRGRGVFVGARWVLHREP